MSNYLMFCLVLVVVCLSHSYVVMAADAATDAAAGEGAGEELHPSNLLESVLKGDVAGMRTALAAGESVDTVNVNGWSAAMFAVINGNIEALEVLIENEIDLNNADNDGITPLMRAAMASDKEMVEILLAANASPLQAATDSATAYTLAEASGRKLVALLVAEGQALHAITDEDSTELMTALRNGAYINIRNPAGWTPLMYAANLDDKAMVKDMIAMEADCNRQENDGWTALHFAASGGFKDVVKLILDANVDYTLQSADGRTARDIAMEEKHQAVVDLIPEIHAEL